MTTLTIAAALSLAATCQNVVAPATIVGIAQHESALDPLAVHTNHDGSVDVGLMQINSANFGWLGLTMTTALDPCRSINAAAVFFTDLSRWNSGSPTRALPYAFSVSADIRRVKGASETPPASASSAAQENEAVINDQPAADEDGAPKGDDNEVNR